MNTRAFLLLLAGVLVLGGGLGGAFVGGIALGKSQGDEVEAQSNLPAQAPPDGLGQRPLGQLSEEQLEQFRSGEFSPQDRDQLRQGQFGQGQFGQGFAGRGGGGLTGTIEQIEGNTVTVNTPQGPLQAIIGADTTIQMFAEGALADLQTVLVVTVTGQRGEDGTVEAISIIITPEGAGGLFGGRLQRDQQAP